MQLFSFIIFTHEYANDYPASRVSFDLSRLPDLSRKIEGDSACRVANDFRDRKIMHWICTESLTLRIQKYLAHHTTSRPSCRPNRVTRVSVRLHPFKIFVSHVSVWLHPCKNFFHPCIRSPDPFRTPRLSVSHPCACRAFACRAFIPKECFGVRGHIYLQVRSDQRGNFIYPMMHRFILYYQASERTWWYQFNRDVTVEQHISILSTSLY